MVIAMAGSEHLYRRRGTARLLLDLLQTEGMIQTVEDLRYRSKVTHVEPHRALVQVIDFAPVLDAFRALRPGQRVVWLAMACGVIRVRPTRWEQRLHTNGRVRPYSEEEVAKHYRLREETVYRAWMESQNRMDRAFAEVERHLEPRE